MAVNELCDTCGHYYKHRCKCATPAEPAATVEGGEVVVYRWWDGAGWSYGERPSASRKSIPLCEAAEVAALRAELASFHTSLAGMFERTEAAERDAEGLRALLGKLTRALENKDWIGPASHFKPEEEIIQTRILRAIIKHAAIDASLEARP